MKQRIFVVSDVHLGGEPGPDGLPGFQICPAANQASLVSFLDALPDGSDDQDVRLVINGDLVDFLAEKPFAAFTSVETEAAEKLKSIMRRTRAVWDALAAFVSRGGSLTLLLGNHDIEMSLPAVRRVVLDTLGNGRVEFIYDNEAFTIGGPACTIKAVKQIEQSAR
jgi:UDP-2,3-diacylglucosamine pyrophosphatase LpxH